MLCSSPTHENRIIEITEETAGILLCLNDLYPTLFMARYGHVRFLEFILIRL